MDFEDEYDQKDRLKGDVKIPFRVFIRRVSAYLYPERRRFILASLLLVINVGLDILLPLITSRITDDLSSGAPTLSFLLTLTVVYFAVCVVNNGFLYLEAMLLQKAGQEIVCTLRNDVFSHIEEMSRSQFEEMPVGSLVTRVSSYTQTMSDLFTNVVVSVIRNFLTVFGVMVIMFFLSPQLALILLIPVTVIFVSSMIFSKYVGGAFRTERKRLSELNAFLNENLSGMRIIQLFGREEKKTAEFDGKNADFRRARTNVIRGFAIYRPFVTFVFVSTLALIFWFGVKMAMTAGTIVAFYLYVGRFFRPIEQLADQLNNIQRARSASERLFNLLDVEPEVRDRPGAVELGEVKGRIEFRHVWFAYEGENWILKDVSFVAEAGQTLALVGATGAGKTTILGLIARNYEIQRWQILLDGVDVATIQFKSLRRVVWQML